MAKTGKADLCFSGFWVLLGLYIAMVSYSLGLGDVQTPGAGFTPFFFGLVLSGFSFVNLLAGLGKEKGKTKVSPHRFSVGAYVKLGVAIGTLIAYGVLVESIGFLITTSLAMIILFRVAGSKWVVSIIWGPVIACLSYFVFVYLGVMLPAGIIRL